MTVISLDVGNNAQRITDAFAKAYSYPDQIPDPNNDGAMIPNPVSKAAFTKQKVADFIRNTVIAVESEAAASTARATTTKSITDNVVIQ